MRETRQYGLFEHVDGEWVRLFPTVSMRKSFAVKFFQSALLAGFSQGRIRELRVVK